MKSWRAVDARNGGVEAQNGDQWSQIHITLMKSMIRIPVRIKVKTRIRFALK
jgi:hypothetical protein